MSRFGKKQEKHPVPEAECDVVTEKSRPFALADLEGKSVPAVHVEVSHHTAKNWGGRHENEDRCTCQKDLYRSTDFWQIGVMDGHDSDLASDLVSRMLPGTVSGHIKDNKPVVEAFVRSMEDLEEALKKKILTAGSCVCSCLVAGRYIWCANLGDCRAVLLQLQVPEDGKAPAVKVSGLHWLSKDQKASTPEEAKRIALAGGKVNGGRVEGLEPSRTLGDFDVKTSTKPGVISIVPEIRRHELGDGSSNAQAILVCATDGVWDVITGQDICDLIHARKELGKLQAEIGTVARANCQALKDLAEDLVQFSIARGSRDDCTAIVAMISVSKNGGK
mmetsp:Transcript_102301/g.218968  ORF Transcript_102301/g.218968 Transcript_102301/m.218968 type:complete len:333 (+) Transcript_102301:96-1094(+)